MVESMVIEVTSEKGNRTMARPPFADLLKTNGHHPQGDSLYLTVCGPKSARWEFRMNVFDPGKGKRSLKSFWLGSAIGPAAIGLTEARTERARVWLEQRGKAPTRQAPHAVTDKPFAEVVPEWLAVAGTKWADKTRDAASRALLRLPFAHRAVRTIKTDDVLPALLDLPERQRQDVRGWLARLFDFAAGRKYLAFDHDGNPAEFEGARSELWPKFKKSGEHHARVARDSIPALYASIVDGDTARALRFLILTAARAGDVEGATWSEIFPAGATFTNADGDDEKLICDAWIIPAERTKERKRRIVPLPAQAMAELGERGKPDALLFGKLASNAMLNLLQKTYPEKTVHGMRSTFRDWAIRQPAVPLEHGASMRDLAELQQGHKLPNATTVELSYARDGLYELRAPLMSQWAAFATGN
jgi:integrase